MLGAIIGDIVGSVYEWDNIKIKEFPLFTTKCFFTDDSVMTIAVAEALLNGGTSDDFIDSFKKFGRMYPNAGYGGKFYKWVFSDDREPYNSWGNGSAMRVAPCAWFAGSLEEAERFAEVSAAVTHNHPEGIKGAKATAAAIFLARINRIDEIKSYIEDTYGYDLNRTLDEIRPDYMFNESCQETVPEAIIAYLEAKDFEDAVRNAISLGGDSDTLAAITGSIAEAAHRIDIYTINRTFHFLDDKISSVINAWLDRGYSNGAFVSKNRWKHTDFLKPHTIKTEIRLNETNYARIKHGLLPAGMEDKWFAYFDDGRIHFHRSWTGNKIYEAAIIKSDTGYLISEIIVERDPDNYKCVDDIEDIRSFHFLIGRGLLGYNIEFPHDFGNDNDILKGWSNFGNMI